MAVPKDSLVADIYGELVKIRRTGLTVHSVLAHAAKLLELPCVTQELARIVGDASDVEGKHDRASAAVNVIECAVAYGIRQRAYRVILWRTLHLAGVPGGTGKWAEWDADTPTVGQRLSAAMRDLRWSELKQKRAEEKMVEAYTELASVLVRRDTSPCRASTDDSPLDIELAEFLDDLVGSATQLLRITRNLSGLGFELDEGVREALHMEMIELLPRGVAEVRKHPAMPDHSVVMELIGAILRSPYARWANKRHSERRGRVIPPARLEAHLIGGAIWEVLTADGFASWVDFQEERTRAIDELAMQLLIAEADGWSILRDPNTDVWSGIDAPTNW